MARKLVCHYRRFEYKKYDSSLRMVLKLVPNMCLGSKFMLFGSLKQSRLLNLQGPMQNKNVVFLTQQLSDTDIDFFGSTWV
jgi:hypothetical protein